MIVIHDYVSVKLAVSNEHLYLLRYLVQLFGLLCEDVGFVPLSHPLVHVGSHLQSLSSPATASNGSSSAAPSSIKYRDAIYPTENRSLDSWKTRSTVYKAPRHFDGTSG